MEKEGFRVRRASLKDMAVLAYQRREMFSDMGIFTRKEAKSGDKAYLKFVKEKMKQGKYFGFLIENGEGKVVSGGCLWLKELQPKPLAKKKEAPYLLAVHTERKYRGQGLASRIVKEAIKWARKHGYPRVELHASDQGAGVYERLGFKRTNEMRYEIKKKKF